jgi:hypothetical protein
MAQSLETPPAPLAGEPPITSNWEREEKAWHVPRQTPVAVVPRPLSQGTRDEELDWKRFVATYFPGTRRHTFEALIAYSDYRRSFRLSKQSASDPDAEAPSIEEWENEGGSPSA